LAVAGSIATMVTVPRPNTAKSASLVSSFADVTAAEPK
jgi:hypothetical protein